jgi:hypothetical protein
LPGLLGGIHGKARTQSMLARMHSGTQVNLRKKQGEKIIEKMLASNQRRKQITRMTTTATESAIANDLSKIDLILAIGSKSAKRKALTHRKACFAEIKKMNDADKLGKMTDDELLAQLLA